MNGTEFMSAIGNINDKYIMESLDKRAMKLKHTIVKKSILSIAACFCIIISATIVFKYYNKPSTPPKGDEIWGNGITDNEVLTSDEQSIKGKIVVSDSLKKAIEKSKNNNDIFAIMVTETSGANKDEIYNTFILPLNVKEEYMKKGIIFATEEQIRSFECPSNLSIILSLAEKSNDDIVIDENIIKASNSKKIKVKIYLKFNTDEILSKYHKELSSLKDEEYQIKQQQIIEAEIDKILKEFIEDYDISDENISDLGIYIPKISAELDKKVILRILDDNRVELVLEDTEDLGSDQVQ